MRLGIVPKVLKQEVIMAKYKISTASKDDKIFDEGFTISNINNSKPRFKLGTQEDADKFNKGGVQIIPLKSKAKGLKLATQEECDKANAGGVQIVVNSRIYDKSNN